jgi:hypothetical protein
MINFAEDLTYWYLRFNGFFMLRNFVLHRIDQANGNRRHAAESDLLAIRFPHVYEEIGGKPSDWACAQFEEWEIEIDKFHLAFIVEITSSQKVNCHLINKKFSTDRLEQAIWRFGIFPRNEVCCIAKRLQEEKYIYIEKRDWIVAKLAVTDGINSDQEQSPWLHLLLSNADKFLQERINAYSSEKYTDRSYFPDALIQYLAWKGIKCQ